MQSFITCVGHKKVHGNLKLLVCGVEISWRVFGEDLLRNLEVGLDHGLAGEIYIVSTLLVCGNGTLILVV
ncbi:hypothetical protein Bca4012_019667 [Brassica carinata]